MTSIFSKATDGLAAIRERGCLPSCRSAPGHNRPSSSFLVAVAALLLVAGCASTSTPQPSIPAADYRLVPSNVGEMLVRSRAVTVTPFSTTPTPTP